MPKRNIAKNSNTEPTFIVKLQKGNNSFSTYRLNQKFFNEIEKKLRPFRSEQLKAKPIKCIETDVCFSSANAAINWLHKTGIKTCYSSYARIKTACKNKKEAYGYHWEFLNP